jgi:hypothetical protein
MSPGLHAIIVLQFLENTEWLGRADSGRFTFYFPGSLEMKMQCSSLLSRVENICSTGGAVTLPMCYKGKHNFYPKLVCALVPQKE